MDQFPAPLPFCSVRIQYSGPPGSVEAQVSSIESGGNLVVESHAQNEGNGWAGSGANPWHLDEDTESVLFLTNESEKPARIGFKVSTDSSAPYYLTKLQLNPHETRALDMRKLRDAQQPDFRNHKIPAAATHGIVMWVRLDKLRVMGHMMVVQHHQDVVSNFLPVCPCPLSYDPGLNYITPEILYLLIGEDLDFTFYGGFQDCNEDDYYYDEDDWADWTSEYPDIATVNSSGAVTGQSSGTTRITAKFSDYDYTYNSSCPQTLVPGGGGGIADVTPTITGSKVVWWFNGQSPASYPTSVTLTANFVGATSWAWSVTNTGTGRISLSSTSTQSVKVTGTALSSKGGNDISIKVQVNGTGGPTSAAFPMTVEGPQSLQAVGTPTDTCVNNSGFQSQLTYQIYDNLGYKMLTTVPANESWTSSAVADYTSENWGQNATSNGNATDGQLTDTITQYDSTPGQWYPTPACPNNGSTAVVHWGQEWMIGSTTSGSGAAVQTDTLQKYLDHGRHLNIVSPVP